MGLSAMPIMIVCAVAVRNLCTLVGFEERAEPHELNTPRGLGTTPEGLATSPRPPP